MAEELPSTEAAWAEVRARWEEEAVHRAFLARFPDLDSLAEAGRRYREALDRDPADPVARRWRDEVVKKATALAMAQLPRTRPPAEVSPARRRTLLAAIFLLCLAAVAWMISRTRLPVVP